MSPSTGLPTPAASPQAMSTGCSPSPSAASPAASQPRRMHNMSISSILSPEDSSCPRQSAAAPGTTSTPSRSTPASSVTSSGTAHEDSTTKAGSSDKAAADSGSTEQAVFTWNEDPKKIDEMLRSLNPDSPEWVVWRDWAEFLEMERADRAERESKRRAEAAAQPTG